MESLILKIFNGKKKTFEKFLHCSKVQTQRSWSHGQKCWYLRRGVVKALALTVQKLLARLKFSKIELNSKVTGSQILTEGILM